MICHRSSWIRLLYHFVVDFDCVLLQLVNILKTQSEYECTVGLQLKFITEMFKVLIKSKCWFVIRECILCTTAQKVACPKS